MLMLVDLDMDLRLLNNVPNIHSSSFPVRNSHVDFDTRWDKVVVYEVLDDSFLFLESPVYLSLRREVPQLGKEICVLQLGRCCDWLSKGVSESLPWQCAVQIDQLRWTQLCVYFAVSSLATCAFAIRCSSDHTMLDTFQTGSISGYT